MSGREGEQISIGSRMNKFRLGALLSGPRSSAGKESFPLSFSYIEREHNSKVLSMIRRNKSRVTLLTGSALPALRSKTTGYGIMPDEP